MKLSFQSVLLASSILYPAAVAADLSGASLPSEFSSSTALGVFAAVLTLALLVAEYSRRRVVLRMPRRLRRLQPLLQPARPAFAIAPNRYSERRASAVLGV